MDAPKNNLTCATRGGFSQACPFSGVFIGLMAKLWLISSKIVKMKMGGGLRIALGTWLTFTTLFLG